MNPESRMASIRCSKAQRAGPMPAQGAVLGNSSQNRKLSPNGAARMKLTISVAPLGLCRYRLLISPWAAPWAGIGPTLRARPVRPSCCRGLIGGQCLRHSETDQRSADL